MASVNINFTISGNEQCYINITHPYYGLMYDNTELNGALIVNTTSFPNGIYNVNLICGDEVKDIISLPILK